MQGLEADAVFALCGRYILVACFLYLAVDLQLLLGYGIEEVPARESTCSWNVCLT